MIRVELTIKKTKVVFLDASKLLTYAKEIRERYETEPDAPVGMRDILYQAEIDGDVSLPKDFEIEDGEEDLLDEDLKDMK